MLVFRGHTGRWEGLMGVYCLDREKGLVNGKRVWKLQGSFRGIDAWYLFYAGDEAARWCVCSTDMFEESFGFVRTAVNTHRHYSPLNQKWEVWATSGEMVADATLRVVPMPIEANHVARVCGAYRKVRCSRPRTHSSRQPRAPRRRSPLSFARTLLTRRPVTIRPPLTRNGDTHVPEGLLRHRGPRHRS